MKIPTQQIRIIVGWIHVGKSNRFVIREFWKRMKGNKAFTKSARKQVYRHALKCHERNKREYRRVMSGQLW